MTKGGHRIACPALSVWLVHEDARVAGDAGVLHRPVGRGESAVGNDAQAELPVENVNVWLVKVTLEPVFEAAPVTVGSV